VGEEVAGSRSCGDGGLASPCLATQLLATAGATAEPWNITNQTQKYFCRIERILTL
jgi:hypothetical protein